MICAPTASHGCVHRRAFSSCFCTPVFTILFFALLGSARACTDVQAYQCHELAYCDAVNETFSCECPAGLLGSGYGAAPSSDDLTPMTGCSGYAWSVRFAINLGLIGDGAYVPFLAEDGSATESMDPVVWAEGVSKLYALFSLDSYPPGFNTSMHHTVKEVGLNYHLIVNALFPTEEAAEEAAGNLDLDGQTIWGINIDADAEQTWAGYILSNPRVYTWRAATTAAGLQFNPTGLQVDSVEFDIAGCSNGCWRIAVTYTLGQDNWNIFYIPRTHEQSPVPVDTLSYDFPYPQNVTDTFQPINFPCRTFDYVPDPSNPLPDEITACCIPEFYQRYRVLGVPPSPPAGTCGSNPPPIYVTHPEKVNETENRYLMPNHYVGDNIDFDGMAGTMSRMENTQLMDPFISQWKSIFVVDEKELRNKAGLLTGTVGVEYTIDTFIGLAEFKPTGQEVLDSFTKQINIHLEKTDLMTVSTHGTNDYTFLTYINLRLIEVLNEDVVYNDDETESNFARTLRYEAAHYLQVTFTMGPSYRPKDWADLIPLDSVRAGYGPFFTDTQGSGALHHSCLEYETPDASNLHFKDEDYKYLFHRRFPHCVEDLEEMIPVDGMELLQFDGCTEGFEVQTCAPNALMCKNPTDTPDSFVIFNVPLGIDYLPAGSMFLDQKVHVQMVIQAYNLDEDPSEITKTTLTASVPVIPGGQNIFCDGLIGRADLADIARAVVLIGSASDESELTRITIIGEGDEKIASTQLNPREPRRVSAASIESGLMTLVVLGNDTYFDNPSQRNSYRSGLELEDLITVHLMEADDRWDADGTLSQKVLELLREEGEENYNENNDLRAEGYRLNGAFKMEIDRAQQRAMLLPSDACEGTTSFVNGSVPQCDGHKGLLWYCGYNLPPPTEGQLVRSGCIIRHDWRSRVTNPRDGVQTAMELPWSSSYLPDTVDFDDLKAEHDAQYGDWRGDTASFMQMVLNSGNYSAQLGLDYSKVIEDRYQLNGRSRRAWWINPSYTWVPSLTGGADSFTLTQKMIMFALFNMNENYQYRTWDGLYEARRKPRRFLMQIGGEAEGESGNGLATIATSVIYETSMAQMLADAYGVPRAQVGSWKIGVQLKESEACMSETQLVTWGRQLLTPMFEQTASEFWTVQVTEANVDRRDVECPDAAGRRSGGEPFSNALVELDTVVVFKGSRPQLDAEAFVEFDGIFKFEEVGEPVVNREGAVEVPQTEEPEKEKSKVAMIGALVGVFGAVVLIGLAGYWYWTRSSTSGEEIQTAVGTEGLENVKIELEADMHQARASAFSGGTKKSEFEDLVSGMGGSKSEFDEFESPAQARSRDESPAPEF